MMSTITIDTICHFTKLLYYNFIGYIIYAVYYIPVSYIFYEYCDFW